MAKPKTKNNKVVYSATRPHKYNDAQRAWKLLSAKQREAAKLIADAIPKANPKFGKDVGPALALLDMEDDFSTMIVDAALRLFEDAFDEFADYEAMVCHRGKAFAALVSRTAALVYLRARCRGEKT